MKLFALIIGFAVFFGYVFVASNAWDVDVKSVDKEGIEVARRRHTIHWDRFFGYIKNIPRKVKKSLGMQVEPVALPPH